MATAACQLQCCKVSCILIFLWWSILTSSALRKVCNYTNFFATGINVLDCTIESQEQQFRTMIYLKSINGYRCNRYDTTGYIDWSLTSTRRKYDVTWSLDMLWRLFCFLYACHVIRLRCLLLIYVTKSGKYLFIDSEMYVLVMCRPK